MWAGGGSYRTLKGKACVICVARARACVHALATRMSHTPKFRSTSYKKCPTHIFERICVGLPRNRSWNENRKKIAQELELRGKSYFGFFPLFSFGGLFHTAGAELSKRAAPEVYKNQSPRSRDFLLCFGRVLSPISASPLLSASPLVAPLMLSKITLMGIN